MKFYSVYSILYSLLLEDDSKRTLNWSQLVRVSGVFMTGMNIRTVPFHTYVPFQNKPLAVPTHSNFLNLSMTGGRHLPSTSIRISQHRATHLKYAETHTQTDFKMYFNTVFETTS